MVTRAVFKWLSKVIQWLRLLLLMIGLKSSRQFFSRWEAKPKPIAPCTRDFSRALSKFQLLGIVIGSSRCSFLLWLVGVLIALVLVFRQSFENRSIIRSDSRRSQSSPRTTILIVKTYRPIRNTYENMSLWKIIVRLIRNAKEKWTHWRKCHPIAAGQKKRSALKNDRRGFICLYVITNSLFCFLILLKSYARVF